MSHVFIARHFPYPTDKEGRVTRENLKASRNELRVLRGGTFFADARGVRCAHRHWDLPEGRSEGIGFRVVMLPWVRLLSLWPLDL